MNENFAQSEMPESPYEQLLAKVGAVTLDLHQETADLHQLSPVERLESINTVWQSTKHLLDNPETVLDVGSGFGYGTVYLHTQGLEVVGIENVQSKVDQGRELFRLAGIETTLSATPESNHQSPNFVLGDFNDLNLNQGQFDLITMFYVSGQLISRPGTFQRCRALLRPGGKVLVATESAPEDVRLLLSQLKLPFQSQVVEIPNNFERTAVILSQSVSRFEGKVRADQIKSWDAYRAEEDEYKKKELCAKLAEMNINLVRKLINERYWHLNPDTKEDLIGVGFIALTRAIEKYDPASHMFSTYADPIIRRELNQYINKSEYSITIPNRTRALLKKMGWHISIFEAQHGHPPSQDQLADLLGITAEEVEQLRDPNRVLPKTFYEIYPEDRRKIHEDIKNQQNNPWEELFGSESFMNIDVERILEAIKSLPDKRMEDILYQKYSGKTYREIGSQYGISRQATEQLLQRAIRYLRKCLGVNKDEGGAHDADDDIYRYTEGISAESPVDDLESAAELHFTRSSEGLVDSFKLNEGNSVESRNLSKEGDSAIGRTLTYLIDYISSGRPFKGSLLHRATHRKYQVLDNTNEALRSLSRMGIVTKVDRDTWKMTVGKIEEHDRYKLKKGD